MAEVTGLRNNALPYPVYGAPWGVVFPMLDADGDLVTGATTPDAERSLNGDTFSDCTNESVEIATASGVYYLLLTAAEMTADVVAVIAKSATAGMKTTVLTFYPAKLPTLRAGTVGANAADGTTLQLDSSASAVDDFYTGCLIVATIDTVVEARVIADYVGSTKVCTISPAFVTAAPDTTDTFVVYQPWGRQVVEAHVNAIAASAITATSIATAAITSAKFAAGAIDAAAIADAAIDAATFAAGAITATAIATDAIGAAEIADGAITAATFAAGAIDATAIAAGAIDAATFAAGAIDAAAIADGAIDANTFAAGAITANAIATDAIGAAELADGAITAATFAAGAIDATAIAAGAIDAATFAAGAIDAAAIADGAIDAATFAANAITATVIADGAIDAATFAAGAITATVVADGTIDAATFAAGAITAAAIADAAIDRATFAADTGLQTIRSNTAAAGGATTITLDAGASAVDDFYNNCLILLTGGTGVGGARFISDYVGGTQVATVAAWATAPDNTSTFAILPFDAVAGASAPTAAQVATAVWQDATAGDFTAASSIGRSLYTAGALPGAAGGHFIAGTNAATVVTTSLTTTFTGNLTGSVGSVTGAVGSVTGAVGSVTGAVGSVAAGGITAASIATDAIDADAMADGAITAATFAAGAIDATAIAANAIGASELAADAVTEIQSGLATQASVDTIDDFLDTEIAAIKAKTDSLTFTVAGLLDANVLRFNGVAAGAANISKTTQAIGRGTVGAASTTTNIVTSAFVPTGVDADQFKGRIITFDVDTTTTGLRGQSTDITASTAAATPDLTVTALTQAPVSGDTFSVT